MSLLLPATNLLPSSSISLPLCFEDDRGMIRLLVFTANLPCGSTVGLLLCLEDDRGMFCLFRCLLSVFRVVDLMAYYHVSRMIAG